MGGPDCIPKLLKLIVSWVHILRLVSSLPLSSGAIWRRLVLVVLCVGEYLRPAWQWTGRIGRCSQMKRLSPRNNQLKLKTSGTPPIALENTPGIHEGNGTCIHAAGGTLTH